MISTLYFPRVEGKGTEGRQQGDQKGRVREVGGELKRWVEKQSSEN